MSNHLEVARRNGKATEEALRSMGESICAQQIRIDGLNAAVTTLSNRLNSLEAMLAVKKAEAMGHGPTT
jgi:hypothetical protein